MVGRNILEHPKAREHEIIAPSRKELDLLNFNQVVEVLDVVKPDLIIHTAGLVGGIIANKNNMFNFMMDNITMGLNVVRAAKSQGVPKMINLGSTCMYPREAQQPMKESYLFTGPLEPTNEGYAIAKNAVQRACQYASLEKGVSYKTYIPCNLFGRWDHYDPENSHLLPAIIRKVHEAKVKLETQSDTYIEIWGSGNPRREFMDAADLADFIFFSLEKFEEIPDVLNVSTGTDLSINEIYKEVVKVITEEKKFGPDNKIKFAHNLTRPDGMMQKLSDVTKQTKLGWKPKITFADSIESAYKFFVDTEAKDSKMKTTEEKHRKVALITGAGGQDGSYLAEFLLNKNYVVVGMFRRNSQQPHAWLKPIVSHPNFISVYGNMQDANSLWKILEEYKPDEIYNLAAQSHVRVSFDCPEETFDVVAMGTLRLLNAAKVLTPKARIYQAGSSEQFGFNPQHPQNEETAFMPASPYACAKVAAHNICVNYREAYKMFIAIGILHNHESPRRGENFVTRKITKAVANIKLGLQDRLLLGNLDAKRDWGFSKEYVECMWKMLQHEVPDDFVIGTGESHSVKEFVTAVFEEAGLDWEKFVTFDPDQLRPHEVTHLESDPAKAKRILGWEPKVKFKELAKIMYESDLSDIVSSSKITLNKQKELLLEINGNKDNK